MSRIGDRFQSVGRELTAHGQRLSLLVTAPILAAAGASAKLAIDAEETASKFRTVLGPAAAEVDREIGRLMTTIPLTREQLRGAIADMTALGKATGLTTEEAAGYSTQLVQAAADMGSFNNVGTDEVLMAIRSALVGSSEPLLRFGVDTRVAALEAVALREGLIEVGEEMTAETRAAAVLAAIHHDAADAMGDAERTASSTANVMKFLKRDVVELATGIGEQLIPMVRPLIEFAGEWLAKFRDLDPTMQKIIVIVGLVAAAIGPLLIVAGTLISAVGTLLPILGAVAAAIGAISAPVAIAVVAIAALAAGIVLLYQRNEEFRAFVLEAWAAIQEGISTTIAFIQELWAQYGDEFLAAVEATWEAVKTVYGTQLAVIWAAIKAFVDVVQAAWDAFGKELFETVRAIWGEIFETVLYYAGIIQDLWEAHGAEVVETIRGHLETLKAVVDQMLAPIREAWSLWGEEILAILGALWNQIGNVFSTALGVIRETIGAVLALIRGDWEGFGEHIQGLVEVLKEGVLGTVRNMDTILREIVSGMWDAVKAVFTSAMTEIQQKVEEFKDKVIGPFQALYDRIVGHSIVPDMWTSIIGYFDDGMSRVLAIVEGGVSGLFGTWEGSQRDIESTVGDGWTRIVNLHGEEWGKILEETAAGADAMESIWDELFGSVSEKLDGWLDGILGDFEGGFGELLGKATDWLGKTGDALGGGFGDWLGKAGDFLGNLDEAFGGGFGDIIDRGKDFVKGLGTDLIGGLGLEGVFGSISKFIGGPWGAAIMTALDLFGIDVGEAIGKIADGAMAAVGAIGSGLAEAAGVIGDAVGAVGGLVGGAFDALFGGGPQFDIGTANIEAEKAAMDAFMAAANAAGAAQEAAANAFRTGFTVDESLLAAQRAAAGLSSGGAAFATGVGSYAAPAINVGVGSAPAGGGTPLVIELDGYVLGKALLPHVVTDVRMVTGVNA